MYIGIEETTDRNHPETKILKFQNEKQAIKWVQETLRFAWSGATDPNLPITQQNFHRRVRELYKMPLNFRINKQELKRRSDRDYKISMKQIEVSMYWKNAEAIFTNGKWERRMA